MQSIVLTADVLELYIKFYTKKNAGFLVLHGICSVSATNQYQHVWQVIFHSARPSALWTVLKTRPLYEYDINLSLRFFLRRIQYSLLLYGFIPGRSR